MLVGKSIKVYTSSKMEYLKGNENKVIISDRLIFVKSRVRKFDKKKKERGSSVKKIGVLNNMQSCTMNQRFVLFVIQCI